MHKVSLEIYCKVLQIVKTLTIYVQNGRWNVQGRLVLDSTGPKQFWVRLERSDTLTLFLLGHADWAHRNSFVQWPYQDF